MVPRDDAILNVFGGTFNYNTTHTVCAISGDDPEAQSPDVVFTLHISPGCVGHVGFICW